MSRKIDVSDLTGLDIAGHLDDERAIAEYLAVVIEENDPLALAQVLGSAARARGMGEIVKAAGIGREAQHKALRPGAQPRFDTVQRVCTALGVRLTAVPL